VIERAVVVALAAGGMLVAALLQAPQRDWAEVRGRVPKIDSTFASDEPERGAGLVVGVRGDLVFIATADHVVEKPSAPAQAIQMSFASQGATVFDGASIVEHDVKLDLALVQLRAPGLASTFGEGRLCYRPPSENEPVTTIGHPLDQLWQVSTVDNVLLKEYDGDPRQFTISGKGVAKGSSGGPVLGADGCLVGLVSRTSAVETIVVSADRIAALAGPAIPTALLGGRSGIEDRARRDTFDAASTGLNSYVFDLEGLLAMFGSTNLDGDRMAREIEKYNTDYRKMYDGRSAMTADIADRFGDKLADRYRVLVDWLDLSDHKQIVYSRLQDSVTALRARHKLTSAENKALQATLTDLAALVTESKTRVGAFVEALRAGLQRP
jgi:hypothetical protein